MTYQYQAGDRVRVVKNSTRGHHEGTEGTIIRNYSDGYSVQGPSLSMFHPASDLLLIRPAKPFKAGDKVKIVADSFGPEYIGKVGTIKFCYGSSAPYEVVFYGGFRRWFRHTEVIAAPVEDPKLHLKAGDWVSRTDFGDMCGWTKGKAYPVESDMDGLFIWDDDEDHRSVQLSTPETAAKHFVKVPAPAPVEAPKPDYLEKFKEAAGRQYNPDPTSDFQRGFNAGLNYIANAFNLKPEVERSTKVTFKPI